MTHLKQREFDRKENQARIDGEFNRALERKTQRIISTRLTLVHWQKIAKETLLALRIT